LNNIYIINGRTIRKQVIGIPMGTNCAPVLANLFLYYYESRYIDGLYADENTKSSAALFHMSFRLIDDTLSIDNPLWVKAVSLSLDDGGIYPSELTLNDTHLHGRRRLIMIAPLVIPQTQVLLVMM
jgi:hypothetical protein